MFNTYSTVPSISIGRKVLSQELTNNSTKNEKRCVVPSIAQPHNEEEEVMKMTKQCMRP